MGISNSVLRSLESLPVDSSVTVEEASFEKVIKDLEVLKADEWMPRGVIRCQEQSGAVDPVNVHGYTIVKCTNKENRDAVKYLRFDFGASGLVLREGETDGNFQNASGIENGWTASIGSTVGWGAGMAAVGMIGPIAAGFMLVAKGSMLVCKTSGMAINYYDCKKGATLDDIYKYVEEHKKKPYTLSTWNCNHFSDGLFAKLSN